MNSLISSDIPKIRENETMLTETSSPSGLNTDFTESACSPPSLDSAIALATKRLLSLQNEAGYWVFELEADCTIPSEYILMMHFMDEIDEGLQTKIANFLRTQ
jgi:squalene-hopene/tetraprenyl-beta-curcumene cyclase